jgi:hypothetical protein
MLLCRYVSHMDFWKFGSETKRNWRITNTSAGGANLGWRKKLGGRNKRGD